MLTLWVTDLFVLFEKAPSMNPISAAIISLTVLALSTAVQAQLVLNEDFKIVASDAAELDRFGASVAISGTTAIVGARCNDDAGSNSGSAYLFDTITGLQIAKLTASDAAADDKFGWSVAISGTTAIVGAYLDDDAGPNSASGSAYLFDTTTGLQIAKIGASDAATSDRFGNFVAISGTTAIVGAYGDDSSTGSAYLFDTTTGLQIAKITASDAARFDEFGISVAISGTTAIAPAINFPTDELTIEGRDWINENFPLPPGVCQADLNGDGSLNSFDTSVFLTGYAANDPIADLNLDGLFNFFDISAFLTAFAAGCP
jgi:FG-GAP repeat